MALGILGTIFFVLIVYAGFLWMTAAGEEDKTGKAKKLIFSGVVGLLIILSAYAITDFVINKLVGATAGSSEIDGGSNLPAPLPD
jgi:Zn-dependent protease with chaperone function